MHGAHPRLRDEYVGRRGADVVGHPIDGAREDAAEDEDQHERHEHDDSDESPEVGPLQTGAERAYHGVILTTRPRRARG